MVRVYEFVIRGIKRTTRTSYRSHKEFEAQIRERASRFTVADSICFVNNRIDRIFEEGVTLEIKKHILER